MTVSHRFDCPHDHSFLAARQHIHERRTWLVIALTASTMVVEIISGLAFGSMALLADGWHMASHASALGIAAMAYYLARRHQDNPRFTFGTGKINDLAGYSSALLLVIIALLMAFESVQRLLEPVSISFDEAIVVAVIGLAVNLISAVILRERHHEGHNPHRHHEDRNLRAAYLHVLADSLTSLLAIVALVMGRFWNLVFMDPVMGIVGALVISRWSYGLMRDSGRVLLDINVNAHLENAIREALEEYDGTSIKDLHVWQLGPGHYGAVISVTSDRHENPAAYKERLRKIRALSHVTIEIN